jgi:EpsI family protein
MRNARAYFPAALMIAGCLGLLRTHSQERVPLIAPLKGILPTVAGYKTKEQTLSDEERAVAGMSDYVARTYWNDTTLAFTTLVTYYDRQAQGKTIHSPRNCLPGAGWEVLSAGTATIADGGTEHTVNHYTLKNGPLSAVVYYWYQGRGRVMANEYRVKWNLLRDAALLGHTEEALVRVVVPIGSTSPTLTESAAVAQADSLGRTIAGRLLKGVSTSLPGFGEVSALR